MTERVLYTLGYTGWQMPDIVKLAQDRMIIDIRYSPWSRHLGWRKESFEKELRGSYVHIQQLGNRNYRFLEKGIDIPYLEFGLNTLARFMAHRPAVIMCACPYPDKCHRGMVARAALEAGLCDRVEHLPVPPKPKPMRMEK